MNRKEKLINSLKSAVGALENGTVNYAWEKQHSCNCGVVSQAILGLTSEQLNERINGEELFKHRMFEKTESPRTWKSLISAWCPITGTPLKQIFADLNDAGLTSDDIAHLEYLENPAILKRSGIKRTTTVEKEVSDGVELKPVDTFFGRLFGLTKPVSKTKVITETQTDNSYYSKKENVILYLKAWISILVEQRDELEEDFSNESSQELEERLLVAVAEENYEVAAKLRDQLIVWSC